MEPTLRIGSYVTVEKGPPVVGAIAVLHPPQDFEAGKCGPTARTVVGTGAACDTPIGQESTVETIKRIVAGPGDELYVQEGHVYRKAAGSGQFVRESEPYIRACGRIPECEFPHPIMIPAGHWFVMGDNRGESNDSRFWGPVPTAWIAGIVGHMVSSATTSS
jgi:signal peptidase I